MSTAAALNAYSVIVNGQGIAANTALISAINTFQSRPNFSLLTTIYSNANTYSNVANVIIPILNTIGSTATQAQFLLDTYPRGITPASTASVARLYGNLASVSGTIRNQANGPFSYGLVSFANVFSFAQSFTSSAVDLAGSIYMLQGKTYGQSGLGYTGIVDLVTGGIGNPAALLGKTVKGWGTMYNITNINLLADPYVFGQNLLDHGFGAYGNLESKLTATGLDTTDITRIPATKTTTTAQSSTATAQTTVGEVEFPTVANVTVTNTVTGNSPDVVLAVYKTITGSDLAAIISSTGFDTTGTDITTLADLLDFKKTINKELLSSLHSLNINDFVAFTKFLNSRVGQGTFKNWADLGEFLATVSVPSLPYLTTTASTPVLNQSTITTIRTMTGTGTGPFGNPILADLLGATSGTPYNTYFPTINGLFNSFPTVYSALQAISAAVTATNTDYINSAADDPENPGNIIYSTPSPAYVSSNVALLDAAMNSLSGPELKSCQTAYISMVNHLNTEVANLAKAGVVFGSASSRIVQGLAQRIPSLGSPDPMGVGTDQFFANIITNDTSGDTIRAAMAEFTNSGILAKGGVTLNNDPNPVQAIGLSRSQNIPLSTYISQNK